MLQIRSIALAITAIVAVAAGILLAYALWPSAPAAIRLTAGTLLEPPKPLPPLAAAAARPAAAMAAGPSAAPAGQDASASARPSSGEPPAPGAAPAAGFIDQDRRAFGRERLEGGWSLMFFGFTNCPDICPLTLALLARVEQRLADLAPALRPRIILVSVDPRRDTPEQLGAYIRRFSPTFTAISAPRQLIEEFSRRMGVVVAITPMAADQRQEDLPHEAAAHDAGEHRHHYTVEHSTAIFLIDPQGAIRALFPATQSARAIAADYRRVLAAAPGH